MNTTVQVLKIGTPKISTEIVKSLEEFDCIMQMEWQTV